MYYYDEIKNELINNEINKKVKYYSINRSDLETYYKVGKILSEAGKHYGEGIIKNYSIKLIKEVDKKYNERTLRRFRQFYYCFDYVNWSQLATNLTWSHFVELLPIKDKNIRQYYIDTCIKNNLSRNELRTKIKSKEYERLPEITKNKIINHENINVKDLVKNPIIIKFNPNYEIVSEKILQKMIIEDIENFLEELGHGFTFIKSEYPIKLGNTYNYIDLLLYNIKYKCYVVIELKITKLKKEHIGQIQIYMNYIDENIKTIEENNTVGIIICKQDNEYIIKYCSDERIIARRFEFVY